MSQLNDLLGVAPAIKEIADISMSGVVVFIDIVMLLFFITMFLSNSRQIKTLHRSNKKALIDQVDYMRSAFKRIEEDKGRLLVEFRQERNIAKGLTAKLKETEALLNRATKASQECIAMRKETQKKIEHLEKTISHLEATLTAMSKTLARQTEKGVKK